MSSTGDTPSFFPPPSPPAPSPAGSSAALLAVQPRRTDVKDTLESILIAFILAFVFRAYIVEAYVIPTGSMATTLLGAHMRFTCPDCGHEFTANYSGARVAGSDEPEIPKFAGPVNARGVMVPRDFHIICPNCGNKIPRPASPHDDGENDARNPAVYYGDRILVQKYLYLVDEPHRWDVVVFKSPYDQPTFQQNYIKRLVGLPGEQLMTLDGDIYTRARESDLWEVRRKSRDVQQALWRLVYDNDQLPKGAPRVNAPFNNPWTPDPASGWTFTNPGGAVAKPEIGGRILTCTAGDKPSVLGFDPDANPDQHALTDFLAFDITASQQAGYYADTYPPNVPPAFYAYAVGDLKLQLVYERKPASGDGPLVLSLSKQGQVFEARFTPGDVRVLTRKDGAEWVELGMTRLTGTGPMQIEFTNVDYQVTVRVNGKEVFATSSAQYSPDVARLMRQHQRQEPVPKPAVRITAERQQCSLSHVSLWRDIFYIPRDLRDSGAMHWGTPDSPISLGPDEFFVMGDNSALSLDARYWNEPIDILASDDLYVAGGRVPRRFMLGKAFLVYWPAALRPWSTGPGIIPNFGNMRFIH